MDSKPIVTCHGDQKLFSKLHSFIVQGLPKDQVEWNRPYGRPRTLNIEANFVPFNPDILPEDNDWSLPGRPFFHTYWLDCDIDTYKASVKEEISDWLTSLRDDSIDDWLIVVVVHDDSKVKTKILRSSVYDKVKSDFCGKTPDRCIVLTEPLKFEGKSIESWNGLLVRMRLLLLQSYDRNLGRFEENMRAERERRTEKGWNFCSYFLLQEELALMFEMLKLFEDALVQYDELDALFTQYVLNHAAGDSADWLSTFLDGQKETWDGLCLSQPINVTKRQLIKKSTASLLDFRNYLFSRQCALRFLLGQPWLVAQDAIPFMHNCMHELQLLEVEMPPGAMACWVFISCLEVIKLCDSHKKEDNPSEKQMNSKYLYTASLWDYARIKLYDIAEICGFVQDESVVCDNSKVSQLLHGASLRAQRWHSENKEDSDPIIRLNEALSSKEAFHKHYLELSELAMGTYKFIGRLRSARKIGKDLAVYYMRLGEWQKAEMFLQDALKMYKQEGWDLLADSIRLDIATCQERLNDKQKLVKSCVHIASSEFLASESRHYRQTDMIQLARQFTDGAVLVRSEPGFWVEEVSLESPSFILHHHGQLTVRLRSMFIDPINSTRIIVSAIMESTSLNNSLGSISLAELKKKRFVRRRRHSSTSSVSSVTSVSGVEFYNHVDQSVQAQHQMLDLHQQVELRPDNKTIAVCSITHQGPLHRVDSGPHARHKERQLVKEDYEFVFEAVDVAILPGDNDVILTGKFPDKGHYSLSQMCIQIDGLEFINSLSQEVITFTVSCDEPTVTLEPSSGSILAGVPQSFTLVLNTGSFDLEDGSELIFRHSNLLSITGEEVIAGVINTPELMAEQEVTFDLEVNHELPSGSDEVLQCEVAVFCPALSREFDLKLEFINPFRITHKLHTTGTKKFIQVVIQNVTSAEFILSQHKLTASSKEVQLLSLNQSNQSQIQHDQIVSYVWQLKNNTEDWTCLLCDLSVHYTVQGDNTSRRISSSFNIDHYVTLLETRSEVKLRDAVSELQVGCVCHLDITVQGLPAYTSRNSQLMYTVNSNSEVWAISGKTTGVFELVDEIYKMRLVATPLTGGHLPLPQVSLVRYHTTHDASIDGLSAAEISRDDSQPEILPFSTGQVYHRSLAQQIHVLPAPNTSHIDVTVAT